MRQLSLEFPFLNKLTVIGKTLNLKISSYYVLIINTYNIYNNIII